MNNTQIAGVFEQISDLLEFQGANAFRIRAYRRGARAIRDLAEPVENIIAAGRSLTEIDGVGKDLAQKCLTLVESGELEMLRELQRAVPESVLDLLRIPGLGPKKAAVLYKELGVKTLGDVRAACEMKHVRELKGFGAKTEETILKGLSIAEAANQRIYWSAADDIVQALLAHMNTCGAIENMSMAGSYRRGKETVGDLDLLVVSQNAAHVMNHFAAFESGAEVIARGDTKMSIRISGSFQIDLRVVPTKSFGAALQYFTGSKEHNVVVRGLARKQGLRVNEYGVFRMSDQAGEDKEQASEYLAGATEQSVYAALGLPLFPPELREARLEFTLAQQGPLPQLIEVSDLRGDLHMHTTASDGNASLEEMAAAAQSRGLAYIVITDHSQRVSMAGGLDEKRLLAQWKEVDRLNEQFGDAFQLLKGVECDILEAGGMDIIDEVLAQADWVVASVHYGQRQSRAQITERILGALANPYVSAIGHPTGRLINRREPYDVDIDAVIQAAARWGKMLELNANPARLDLNEIHCAAAKSHGVPIVINSDAHSTAGLDVLRFGVLQARRAGLTKNDVANTRAWEDFKKLLPGS